VAVRVALAVGLLLIQIPAWVSIRRLPAGNSRMAYRITWVIFMLTTTLCSSTLAASVMVTVLGP